MTLWRDVAGNTALSDAIALGIANFRKGVTAPADGTIGTTPTTPTLLFAAANELLTVGAVMPANWDRTIDITLQLFWALASAQANNDTLDLTIDYTVPRLVGAAGPDKTSTQVTGQITAVTGRLAVADPYQMSIAMARADAQNPYTAADAFAFVWELHLTNVLQVASAHFLGGRIDYERLR